MRPHKDAKAHHTNKFAELVCSNSLKSNALDNASGLMKEEMRMLDSIIISCADATKVPAGQSLSVDREKFSEMVTERIKSNPLIEVINEEATKIPEGITIIASGPLTSDKLSEEIKKVLNDDSLYFYDASAPLIDASTINMDIAYKKSRYDKGEPDYINCPFDKEQFFTFYEALINGERAPLHSFEKENHFEACMPIEVIGKRNFKSLTFGPMKPVGLEDKNGKRPFAVVQLRQDNTESSLYNIVGFQTNLKWGEQDKIIKLIPGLENATIYRYGVMHRNTFINAPKHLLPTMQLKENSNLFIAGQLSGVEGYIESSASAIIAAINAVNLLKGNELITMPLDTVMGSLINYICTAQVKSFQPMNSNYGILANKSKDKMELKDLSLNALKKWIESHE
jgi:methylenetetrahydrofolate--tRNA-(uracil-5-)-methyltransferase